MILSGHCFSKKQGKPIATLDTYLKDIEFILRVPDELRKEKNREGRFQELKLDSNSSKFVSLSRQKIRKGVL